MQWKFIQSTQSFWDYKYEVGTRVIYCPMSPSSLVSCVAVFQCFSIQDGLQKRQKYWVGGVIQTTRQKSNPIFNTQKSLNRPPLIGNQALPFVDPCQEGCGVVYSPSQILPGDVNTFTYSPLLPLIKINQNFFRPSWIVVCLKIIFMFVVYMCECVCLCVCVCACVFWSIYMEKFFDL